MRVDSFLSKLSEKDDYKAMSNIPICYIIPEYVNKKIVEKGTKEQKERAWKNVILTEQLRGRRQVTGLLTSMLSVSDRLHRLYMMHRMQKVCQVSLCELKAGR